MSEIVKLDSQLAEAMENGHLAIAPSGNGCPLIDLANVSSELAREADGADLVVLEGMGRAVQSNNNARFTCDVMKLAMIKDAHVAQKLGCPLMACFCKFEQRI